MLLRLIKRNTKSVLNKLVRNNKVAMFHPGRCGSTVLGSLMNQNKDFWSGEPFEKLMRKDISLGYSDVIRVIKQSETTKVSRIFCFATKYLKDMHLSMDCINMSIVDYVGLLKEMGYEKFIVIDRSNHLKRAISMENGRISNVWHTTSKVKGARKVKIDPHHFEVGIDYFLSLSNYFQSLDLEHTQLIETLSGSDFLKINYEKDIEGNPVSAYQMVCDFLKLNYVAPTVTLKKTNPYPVKETLLNFDEVAQVLNETSFSWMLNE